MPEPLIDQLAENGKLVIPVGEPGNVQELMLREKKHGKIKKIAAYLSLVCSIQDVGEPVVICHLPNCANQSFGEGWFH
jgi:protein-L-isoaspartate O-methyltransferase